VITTDDDPTMKIRYIFDKLKTSFKTVSYQYEKLCIDESLLLFKGRCYFKQYILSKRSRFGIKSFVLCDRQDRMYSRFEYIFWSKHEDVRKYLEKSNPKSPE